MAETYKNGYFDIQDILASQERITCKFDIDISNMGRVIEIKIKIKRK